MALNPDRVRGILFDYGGTVDSNGLHWSEAFWQAYLSVQAPVTKEVFREAYVHGERTLARHPLIQPRHTFADMLRMKTALQVEWLAERRHLPEGWATAERQRRIATAGYACARRSTAAARPVLAALADRYPLVLVSNFYGNIATVLKEFGLETFFPVIVESAVCGVRKPDPQIFRLGLAALRMTATEAAVVGDSYDKDILPAASLGCQTVWLKNTGWKPCAGNETADAIISSFEELENVFG
ncbi:MAG: HAD family hydrolase [Tannerella sp.]|jgi:putative hydrolase of the HAD superfamily|nr:HAD family hydrolase [Tannerella sp.]